MTKSEWKKKFPGMPSSKKYCKLFRDYDAGIVQATLYYIHWVDHRKDMYFIEQMEDFVNRTREVRFNMEAKNLTATEVRQREFALDNCKVASIPVIVDILPPAPLPSFLEIWYPKQEKGNNPMRVTSEYNTPIASASVINAKSDEAFQREYLLTELSVYDRNWADPKFKELQKLFNIGTSNQPNGAEELIEKITKGQYKLDEKKMARLKAAKANDSDYDDDCDCEYIGDVFYGIIWDGVQPDRKGYDAAIKEYDKAKADTKRKIIVSSPADGLQALLDLEAWLPTGKAN